MLEQGCHPDAKALHKALSHRLGDLDGNDWHRLCRLLQRLPAGVADAQDDIGRELTARL
jgi:hypothetical protein